MQDNVPLKVAGKEEVVLDQHRNEHLAHKIGTGLLQNACDAELELLCTCRAISDASKETG